MQRKSVVAKALLVAALVAAPALVFSSGMTASASPGVCRRVALTQRPGWATTGAWTDKGDLLIADALRKSVLRYSHTGRSLGTIPEKIGGALENLFPQVVRSSKNGLLVEVLGGELVALDNRYVPQSKISPIAKGVRPDTNDLSLEGMFLWEPAGNDILAFSDIHGPRENDWSSAFVRFPIGKPEQFSILRSSHMQYRAPSQVFYRLGFPFITSLGDTAYALSFAGNTPSILRSVRGRDFERISAFPAELAVSPQLPSFESRGDLVSVMRTVEASTMPTGLFGWEDHLYVLWRKPEGSATRWFLTKIDPVEDRLLGTISIGTTTARHLSVVPGPTAWAFIEKGSVRGWGLQDIGSILLVPSSKLRQEFRAGADLCN